MLEKKQLLSYLRNGDFAHAGGREAIDLVMQKIPFKPTQKILDVGCGLGGTANYLFNCGWKNINAIDIDAEAIGYAKKTYTNIEFFEANVLNVAEIFKNETFNIFFLFNSFYCFQSQSLSLKTLSQIAHQNSQLIIFDYSKLKNFKKENPFLDNTSNKPFSPIEIDSFQEMANAANWLIKDKIDLTNQFKDWYEKILNQMNQRKNELINKFSIEAFESVYTGFSKLLRHFQNNELGGIVIYLNRKATGNAIKPNSMI